MPRDLLAQEPIDLLAAKRPEPVDVPSWVPDPDGSLAMAATAPSPAALGGMASGFVPGVGAASALAGKELEFDNPDSPLPTGAKDVNTIFGNLRDKKYGAAAMQGLGMIPDVGYATKAIKGARAIPGALAAREKVPLISERVANPLVKPGRVAVDELQRAFDAGKITPAQLETELANLGPGAVPADVPAFAALHAKVAKTPGAPGQKAADVLAARDAATPERLSAVIGDTISNKPFHETKESLKAVSETATAPLYEKAYASGTPVYDDELGRMLADPKVQKNLKGAVENQMSIATGRGETPKLSDWGITGWNEAGDPIVNGVPNMRTIHAAREAIDAQIEGAREPVTRKLDLSDPKVKALNSLRSGLTRKMHELGEKNPETGESLIKEADAEHARYRKLDEALDTGYDALKNDPEINQRIVKGSPEYRIEPMTDAQREMAQRGLARNLMEQVTGKGAKSAVDLFQNEEMLNRMRPFFKTQADMDKFKLGITAQARMAKTAEATGVDKAALRTGQEASRLGEPSAVPGAVNGAVDLATASKLGKTKRALSWAANKLEPDGKPIADQLADFLYSNDAEARARVYSRMRGDKYLPPAGPTALPGP